jgi:hypothetical protein
MDQTLMVFGDAKAVVEKMGVSPAQIVDYLALCGDSSDNILISRMVSKKGKLIISLSFTFETVSVCPLLESSVIILGFNAVNNPISE